MSLFDQVRSYFGGQPTAQTPTQAEQSAAAESEVDPINDILKHVYVVALDLSPIVGVSPGGAIDKARKLVTRECSFIEKYAPEATAEIAEGKAIIAELDKAMEITKAAHKRFELLQASDVAKRIDQLVATELETKAKYEAEHDYENDTVDEPVKAPVHSCACSNN